MVPRTPLSVELSRLLLAFTIELDNEFERRMAATLPKRPFRMSLVMWSNFLRFVGDGIPVGELPAAAGLPKPRVLSTLGGMERWRYVWVVPPSARKPPATTRDGYGSARGLRAEWVVRPTPAGLAAQGIWPVLLPEIESRWGARFGAREIAELREASRALDDERLPEYLPIVAPSNGMATELAGDAPQPSAALPLSAVLARVLLAYTLAFERGAPLSLPLAENVVRVLGADPLDVRDIARAAAVSPEAVAMSLTALARRGLVDGRKAVRLTDAGRAARDASQETHVRVERDWRERHGTAVVERLRSATSGLLEQGDIDGRRLARGLEPYPDGWRAEPRYRARTDAMLADPLSGLPRHPMVLHRGGWPDGS
jgi:DNA-binding MarR family transcriptional regulator